MKKKLKEGSWEWNERENRKVENFVGIILIIITLIGIWMILNAIN